MNGTHFFPHRRGEVLGGILRRTLDRHGLGRRLDRHIPAAAWADAVGAELAARAQPTVLSCGTLHVLVQDHRWRDQLDAARAVVIERINRRLGHCAVRALQFGLAHEGVLRARTTERAAGERRRAPAPAGAHQLPAELRDVFLRAAAARRERP